MTGERQYWLGFSYAKGFGPVRVRRMLDIFGSLQNAWKASRSDLRTAGVDTRTMDAFLDMRDRFNLDAELARLDKLGIGLLTWDDDDYPTLLKQLRPIDEAPPVLYIKGSLVETDEWAVAIVGTRGVSAYGRHITHELASSLAANGLTIVSGLARGADAEAHKAALEAGGRTIAVLPCGLDDIYPPEHRLLAAQIIQQGALVGIFPPGTQPLSTNFPARNRVISGLARGVVVTEAGEHSGALLTAAAALEQGREVFAVPGNITAQGSTGTNRLIQDGAHPVLTPEDVLSTLNLETVFIHAQARQELPSLGPGEERLLASMSGEPMHIDDLSNRCQLPVSVVSSTLVMLELKGLVRQVASMTYVRT